MEQINDTLLFASREGYTKVVKMMLEANADVNAKDIEGWTALMLASIIPYNNYTEIVKLLLEAGADVNAKDKDGDTVLIKTSGDGYTEIVKILLEAGADINAKNINGETALDVAKKRRRIETTELLKEKRRKNEQSYRINL